MDEGMKVSSFILCVDWRFGHFRHPCAGAESAVFLCAGCWGDVWVYSSVQEYSSLYNRIMEW